MGLCDREIVVPPAELCTDNGAMIAWAGAERLALGLRDTLDVAPRPRWPLGEVRGPATEIDVPPADGAQAGAAEPAAAPRAGPG